MRTKLEILVSYLAGRGVPSDGPIRGELGDPSSEAGLFLEELRERSRGMLDAGLPEVPDLWTTPLGRAEPGHPGRSRRLLPALVACGLAATLLVALGLGWRAQEERVRRLEDALARRDAQWKERVGHLELALAARDHLPPVKPPPAATPTTPPIAPDPRGQASVLMLARLEDGLAKLDRRLKESEGPRIEPVTPTPADDQMRQDIEGLKQDFGARERALRDDLGELRSTLQGVIQVIRQLSAQTMMGGSMPIPYQVPFPAAGGVLDPGRNAATMPGQAPASGLSPTVPNAGHLHPGAVHPGHHPDHRMPGQHSPGGPG